MYRICSTACRFSDSLSLPPFLPLSLPLSSPSVSDDLYFSFDQRFSNFLITLYHVFRYENKSILTRGTYFFTYLIAFFLDLIIACSK